MREPQAIGGEELGNRGGGLILQEKKKLSSSGFQLRYLTVNRKGSWGRR